MDTQIKEAVAYINKEYSDSRLKATLSIGNYLFKNFFNSDEKLVSSKDPNKTATFQALLQQEELCLDKSQLSRMVRVAIQEKFLVDSRINVEGLTYSHRVELLPLANDESKKEFIKEHNVRELTVRKLRETIKGISTKDTKKKVVSPTKSIATLAKALEKAKVPLGEISPADLEEKDREKLMSDITELLENIKQTAGALNKILKGISQPNVAETEEEGPEAAVATVAAA